MRRARHRSIRIALDRHVRLERVASLVYRRDGTLCSEPTGVEARTARQAGRMPGRLLRRGEARSNTANASELAARRSGYGCVPRANARQLTPTPRSSSSWSTARDPPTTPLRRCASRRSRAPSEPRSDRDRIGLEERADRGQVAHDGLPTMVIALDRDQRWDIAVGSTLAPLLALGAREALLDLVSPILARGRALRHRGLLRRPGVPDS